MSALVPTRVMEMHRREQAALGGRIAVGAAELVRTRLNVDDPDRGFSALLAALLELIRGGRSVSEELAMEFYRYLREVEGASGQADRKSTRLNSSHVKISYAVFCLKKKKRANKRHAPVHD